jgi:putative transposase
LWRPVHESDDFRNELAKHGIEASMSSTGNCYNNAVAESFFGLLKRERVNRVRYRTREEARADVFEYIEIFYNRERRHGYLGNISPAEFEQRTIGLGANYYGYFFRANTRVFKGQHQNMRLYLDLDFIGSSYTGG